MAIHVKISMKGFDEYLEKIVQAGENVDAAAGRAIEAAAEVARDGMKKRVAEDTGNLKNHIQIKGPQQDGNFIFAEVGLIPDIAFTDAETARYGTAQEYGTSSMPAHPYILPTLKEDKNKIRKAEKESLEKDSIL